MLSKHLSEHFSNYWKLQISLIFFEWQQSSLETESITETQIIYRSMMKMYDLCLSYDGIESYFSRKICIIGLLYVAHV